MAFNKNQHFVPKVHLRPFTVDGEKMAINLINIDRLATIKNAPVKNQCSRDYFYGKDPKLESAINFVENHYGEVVRMLERGHPNVDGRVTIVLARFIYLQYLRTEAASRAMSEMVLALQNVPGSDIPLPSMREAMLEAVQAAMHHYREAMRIVDDLTLCLVRNQTNMPFITSDDPAVLTNRLHFEKRGKALRSFGPKSAGALFLLPLSPDLCAIMFDSAVYASDHQNGWIDLTSGNDVAALNAHQILRCNSNIYFRDWDDRDELLAEVAAVKPRRPATRQTVTHLVLEEVTDWGEKYVVNPITDIRDGKKVIVHVQTNHPEPAAWPNFLRIRPDATAFSNDTGAGLTRLWCLEAEFVQGDGYSEISV